MPKLDLDAAKKRFEWHKKYAPCGSSVSADLSAALAECEWSREMLERVSELLDFTRCFPECRAWLRDLEKGPPDVA